MNKPHAWIRVFCVIGMLSSVAAADFAGLPILRGVSFKMVTIPVYDHSTSKPSLFLEIQKIDIQARRFDFLIVPSLPQMVFHGVKIILLSDKPPTLVLKVFSDFSRGNTQFQTGIMEEVTLMDSSGKVLLSAKNGIMSRSGSALILHDASLDSEKQEIIKEGRLELIGPDSGKLFWNHAGKQLSRNVPSTAE